MNSLSHVRRLRVAGAGAAEADDKLRDISSVAELKSRPGKALQIYGSGRLAASLLTAGLLVEIRLVAAPVVLGQGRRLFSDRGPSRGLRAVDRSSTPGGITVLVFETTGDAEVAEYEGIASVIAPSAET